MKKDRLGTVGIAHNGMKMTIVRYAGTEDLDAQLEDGIILRNLTYDKFRKGLTRNKYISQARVGEEVIFKNDEKAKIIAYYGANDIDVQFEDGTVVSRTSYSHFKKGEIGNPSKGRRDIKTYRVGEKNIANNGMEMEIIAYYSSTNMSIRFEDGTIVEGISYKCFRQGVVSNPKIWSYKVGESVIANNGQRLEIVGYYGAENIDVMFEDGTVVKGARYKHFKKGSVKNPNKPTVVKRKGSKNVNK